MLPEFTKAEYEIAIAALHAGASLCTMLEKRLLLHIADPTPPVDPPVDPPSPEPPTPDPPSPEPDPEPDPALKVYSTQHSIGIEWDVADDPDHRVTCDVKYRRLGDLAWKNALPLFRVNHNGYDMLAGSILYLVPGSSYKVILYVRHPDRKTTTSFLAVTQPVPTLPTGGNTYHVAPGMPGIAGGDGSADDPFWGIDAAQAVAQPGDICLLHAGTYRDASQTSGRVRFAKDGEPGNYIVWKAASDGKVVFDRGIRIAADHVWLEGLHVQGPSDGTFNGLLTHDAPKDVVISRNKFTGCRYSVWLNKGGEGWYIADNTIVGDVDPEVSNYIGEGIELQHTSGHTVCHNTISRVSDGISYPYSNVDIFGNDIFDTADDGIEGDYGHANIRIWGNRITNALNNGISFQPMDGAPWYIIRNQVIVTRQGAIKMSETSNALIAHNTFVSRSGRVVNNAHKLVEFQSRNNLWINANNSEGGRIWEAGINVPMNRNTDLDYDGFDQADALYAFKWQGQRYSGLEIFSEVTGLEKHGVVTPTDETFQSFNVPIDGPAPRQYLTLRGDSAAIDAGEVLPNINDGYRGGGPDLGAHEYGALPTYGVRARLAE